MSSISAGGEETAGSAVSREIQALRAFAVLAVLLYHLWPQRVTGGFVGVDVFFVVSGFLITLHLARELASTGTIALGRFWARRARRLLPASFLVLGVTAIATLAVVPSGYWQQFFREIGASALYIENWVLAADAVDYLAAENLASPVQHYWSLGVEEQIYLVWPLLLVAVALLARTTTRLRRVALPVAVLAVLIASFAYSSALVVNGSPAAYFVTPARVWEFAAGGLLALVMTKGLRLPAAVASALAWTGWFGLTNTVLLFDTTTPFPGYGALPPVIFTLLIIIAGSPAARWAPTRVLSIRPVQWLGDVSYATYLWHWPLIVLLPFALDRELTTVDKLVILLMTLVLAGLSTRFVEQPFRFAPWSRALSTRAVLASTVVLSLVFVGGSAAVWTTVQRSNDAALALAAERAAQAERCFGAGAGLDPEGCAEFATTSLTPSPALARDDRHAAYSDSCITPTAGTEVRTCEYGNVESDFRVAIIGDSHAANWFPAFDRLANERDWHLITHFKSACPESAAVKRNAVLEAETSCRAWNEQMATGDHIDAPYDLVVVSYSAAADSYDDRKAAIYGFISAWQKYIDDGSIVVVMADNARNTPEVVECLVRNEADPSACSVPFEQAYPGDDNMVAAAARIPDHAVVIETSDIFCGDEVCNAAIGGVVVYRDSHHLTKTFATTLSPYIGERLDSALALLPAR